MKESDRCESCREAMGFYRWATNKRQCDECFDKEDE